MKVATRSVLLVLQLLACLLHGCTATEQPLQHLQELFNRGEMREILRYTQMIEEQQPGASNC